MLNNQFSSSQINETLLNAMKMIAQKEVQNLEFDVTEKYTILEKTKDKNGETCYIINMNNIKREVYPINNEEYYPDDVVLIQIPKNNILEKKYILGLANSATERCFLPSSNFIPIVKKDSLKGEISLSDGMFNNNFYTFSGTILAEKFLQCNAIYVKCDFRVNYLPIDYNYGIELKVLYLNGRNTTYYFTNDSFIGNNSNFAYYFTQDILFDNIPDFEDIKQIDVKFYTTANLNISSQVFSQISLRNLEVSIGKSIADDKMGLEIISESSSLDYNETTDDFYRKLGLIWYNRNSSHDFVGFGEQIIVNEKGEYEDILTEVKNGDYSTIMTNEYEYIKKKKFFDKYDALYQTDSCPFDLFGLDLIQKINEANEKLQKAINCFSDGSAITYNCLLTAKEFWLKADKLLNPANITNDLEIRTLLSSKFGEVVTSWEKCAEALENFSNKQTQSYNTINELYNIWNNFSATVFVNIHNMQNLTKNLSNLEIEGPKDKDGNDVEIKNIVSLIKAKEVLHLDNERVNLYNNFLSAFEEVFQKYFEELCQETYLDLYGETKQNNWKSQVIDLKKQYTNLFYSLTEDILDAYNSISLVRGANKDILFEGFYENKDFIDVSYNTNLENNPPYYNLYLLKYQNYLIDLENNKIFDENFSIIEEGKEFNPLFDLDESTKNKFALYWYEEDLNNLEIDELLNEDCWTRINQDDDKEYLTFPTLKEEGVGDKKKYYLNKATPYERMISVTLPAHLKTKTYKVVLYYNHQLQGSAEITFNNKSYVDIGFENTLIDLEYGKSDFKTLSLNKFGKSNRLPISVFCYNEKNGREILTNVTKSEISNTPTTFPTLQMLSVLSVPEEFNSIEKVTNKEILKAKRIGKKGEINFVFKYQPKERLVPFGVYQFKLWLDAETTTTSYLPMAWSLNNHELSLQGAKMVLVEDDNSFSYDSWVENKTIPMPFKITGANNISNLNFFIEYYQGGFQVDAAITNGEPFSIIKNNNQYQLSFDITQAKQCLKKGYKPVLKITGTCNNNEYFTFYQSLFIWHNKYDYTKNVFIDNNQNLPQSSFIFINPNEEIFANDVKAIYAQGSYSFVNNQSIVNNIDEQTKALEALDRILYDEKVSKGYDYYFSNLAIWAPRDKQVYIDIFNKLKDKTFNWEKKLIYSAVEYGSISTNKKTQELTVSNWIGLLFTDLDNFGNRYETAIEAYESALSLSYEDVNKLINILLSQEEDK